MEPGKRKEIGKLIADLLNNQSYRKSAFDHGFLEGLMRAVDILVTGTNHEQLKVETYDEQTTAKGDLGLEAIKLLRDMPEGLKTLTLKDENLKWWSKRNNLLQCWELNTEAKALRRMPGGRDSGESVTLTLSSDPSKVFHVKHQREFLDIPEVLDICSDSPSEFEKIARVGLELYAFHEGKLSHIGTLSKVPSWMTYEELKPQELA